MTFWASWNTNATTGMKILGVMEDTFECASLCTTPILYTFSDVAKYILHYYY